MDILGKKRPLNSMEAGNIYNDLKKEYFSKSILLGFQQVTQDKKISVMDDALNLVNKHISLFSSVIK